MNRRDFITLLTRTAAAWPLAAQAQQAKLPVIGYLSAGVANSDEPNVTGLRRGLNDGGYTEGRNVEILFQYADERFDRVRALAADLVRRRVAVIVASGLAPALAAKAATATIPIVFESYFDPIANGLVTSLNRPGGNVTGASMLVEAYFAKGVELLHELVPQADSIAVLINPTNSATSGGVEQTATVARVLGLRLVILKAGNALEFEQAFKTIAEGRIGALLVNSDRLFSGRFDQLAALALRYRVPSIFTRQEAVQAGGLMSYGASLVEAHRITGNYAARILKGDKPADLPIQQATKIELSVNLKTAKALGIEVPTSILLRADEVIE
jgi:putative ABC transport system substrate-binding protein